MLVDAGAADTAFTRRLVEYLNRFFARRTDLNRTLNAVLITHNHIDHTRALRTVVDSFTVERYIDNGFTTGSGAGGPNWLRDEVDAGRKQVQIRAVLMDSSITTAGLTDSIIDPFTTCQGIDPRITVLSGPHLVTPGWPESEFDNQNNHSLVMRVDFGVRSLLFLGDLEIDGIDAMLAFYEGDARQLLDVEVLQVGHHGSFNETSDILLEAVSPRVAVIPVGFWRSGHPQRPFTTFVYGHPRLDPVALLERHITRNRSPAKTVMVAQRSKCFARRTVRRAVYATGWDGTIRVVARSRGIAVYRDPAGPFVSGPDSASMCPSS
jgi:beta-lactamase superfamily II metal-dependent hydrolase